MDEALSNNKLTEVFLEQERIYGSSPYFYLTALKHFNEKSTNDFIGQIETKLLQKFEDNPNALKGLAYLYENQNRVGEALSLYKKIFVIRPRYTQSYRDLANMYVVNKQYQKGLGIYARYKSFRKLDTIAPIEDGIDAVMDTETTNLMALHADQLSISNEDRIDGDIGGIRILFE